MSQPPPAPSAAELVARGLALHQSRQMLDAEKCYRQAIALEPENPDALHLLGVLAAQAGHPQDGLRLVDQAIALTPHAAAFHANRGTILRQLEQLEMSVESLRRAVTLNAGDPGAFFNLGHSLRELGRWEEAIDAYRHAVGLNPLNHDAHTCLGNALRAAGRIDEALEAYQRAIDVRPDMAELHSNLGIALGNIGRLEEAIAAYERAIRLKPALGAAHINLSQTLRDVGRLEEAVDAARAGAELGDYLPEARINLGNALIQQGRVEEAIAEYRAAVARNPALVGAADNVLLALHNRVQDPCRLFAEHTGWAAAYARPLEQRIKVHNNDRDPGRRLRVGYVSADLRAHPVGRLLLPVLEAHDRRAVEVICYAQVIDPDELTARLRAASDQWHDITPLRDDGLADLVRRHSIDILVDLGGHTSGNRLLVFAQKPAPVQVTWLGYPDTTGLSTIDYRVTDAIADPPGESDALHTEKLVRLAGCFLCLRPPHDAIADAPERSAAFTFGCFNNFTKVSPELLRLWAQILAQAPAARLLLKARGLADAKTAQAVRQTLAAHGLPIDRVDLLSHVDLPAHLAVYNRIDAALDTFPYSGTATTCDALSMGVPVITLAGSVHAARVSASLLAAAQMPQWIAPDEAAYVRLAVEAAANGPRSTEDRRALCGRLQRSPLCDEPAFAREIERAYREMWRTWCRRKA